MMAIDIGEKYKIEDAQETQNGTTRGKLYQLETDEHGRESWIFAAWLTKKSRQAWDDAIEQWEMEQIDAE